MRIEAKKHVEYGVSIGLSFTNRLILNSIENTALNAGCCVNLEARRDNHFHSFTEKTENCVHLDYT